jgi:hypothetical protein
MIDKKIVIPQKNIQGISFFCVKDIAKILGLSIISARLYLKDGKIPGGLKIGGVWYVSNRNLNKWLNKDIFSKPEPYILATIKEAMDQAQERNFEILYKRVKEAVMEDFIESIKVNLKDIDIENAKLINFLPRKSIEHLKNRQREVKKEFQKV